MKKLFRISNCLSHKRLNKNVKNMFCSKSLRKVICRISSQERGGWDGDHIVWRSRRGVTCRNHDGLRKAQVKKDSSVHLAVNLFQLPLVHRLDLNPRCWWRCYLYQFQSLLSSSLDFPVVHFPIARTHPSPDRQSAPSSFSARWIFGYHLLLVHRHTDRYYHLNNDYSNNNCVYYCSSDWVEWH